MTGGRHRKSLIPVTLALLLLSAIGLNACHQAAPTTSAPNEGGGKVPTVVEVNISDSAFSPATVTVTGLGGAYIIWTNKDSVTHIVRSDDDLFDSGDLSQGETYAHLLNKKGTYLYHCRIHPSMTGKIIVGQ